MSVELVSASQHPVPLSGRTLWGVTWPLLMSLALTLSLNFVDAFFLSRISDQAAAAAGALLPLLGATVVIFASVGQAGCSVASQLMGARRHSELPAAYLALVGFNTGLGFLTSAAFFVLHRKLPLWLGLEGRTAEYAQSYLLVLGSFQFLKAAQVAYGNILNSRGETRWVLAEALLTNLCNIALNLVFLHGSLGVPKLGVVGVALSTVLSLALGLCFTVCVVHFKMQVRFGASLTLRALLRSMTPILRIGVPSALEPAAYQCAQMSVNLLVISLGAAALAARVYVFNFYLVTTMLWSLALGIGTQILIAHRIGAGDFEAADAELRRALRLGILGNLAIAALLALLHPVLMRALTSNTEVQELAAPLFLVAPLVEVGRAANIVCGGALRSSGDARYTSLVGMFLMWGVGVPACYLFGDWLGYGLTGVWLGMAVDEITRGCVNYRRWRQGHWQRAGIVTTQAGS